VVDWPGRMLLSTCQHSGPNHRFDVDGDLPKRIRPMTWVAGTRVGLKAAHRERVLVVAMRFSDFAAVLHLVVLCDTRLDITLGPKKRI
jgi:hypothetical protein